MYTRLGLVSLIAPLRPASGRRDSGEVGLAMPLRTPQTAHPPQRDVLGYTCPLLTLPLSVPGSAEGTTDLVPSGCFHLAGLTLPITRHVDDRPKAAVTAPVEP